MKYLFFSLYRVFLLLAWLSKAIILVLIAAISCIGVFVWHFSFTKTWDQLKVWIDNPVCFWLKFKGTLLESDYCFRTPVDIIINKKTYYEDLPPDLAQDIHVKIFFENMK